jgi:long-chain acyl-CoA synthetase
VAVLAENRPEWHVADVATMAIGAVTVPLYLTSAPEQVAYVLGDSGARACFVDGDEQLAKVLAVRDEVPKLDHIVVMEPGDHTGGGTATFVVSLDALRASGRLRLARDPSFVDERVRSLDPDAPATFVYTSGTTGPPKGAVITHRNITWTITALTRTVPIYPSDRFLSYLPLSHIAERIVSDLGQIVSGGETWFARGLATVPEDLRACRPTVFFAVPRVWEKLHEAIVEQVGGLHGLARRLADDYLALGPAVVAHRDGEGPAPLVDRLRYQMLDAVVGASIRRRAGLDKARLLVSAAAPVSPALLRWFHGIGLPIAEVYGQTEDCGPATVNPPDAIRIGTVGRPLVGLQVRIADDGEILVKGGSVCAGYHGAPEASRELVGPDGWMRTGDVGILDADGYLTITDRKKDLIITEAGQNVAPQQIETELRLEPLIGQPVVIGDRRPYLTALVTLDAQQLAAWAGARGKIVDPEALAADPEVRDEVRAAIERVNARHARAEGIKKFRILPHEFTTASGELTPTLKVRRRFVNDKYADLVDTMYVEEG